MFDPETEFNIYEYVTIVRKRLLLIILTTLAVITGMVVHIYLQPAFYTARAKVLFEYSNPAAPILAQPYYYVQRIIPGIEQEMILNSKIIGRVIRNLNLSTAESGSREWYGQVNRIRSFIRIRFQDTQNMNIMYGSRMIANLIATTPTPELATSLLNSLVEQYQIDQQEYKLEQDLQMKNWLDIQLKEAKAKIEEAEKNFQKFKQEKGILSIKELQEAQVDNFSVLEKEYNIAVQQRKSLELRLNTLKSALNRDEETSNLIFSNSDFPEIAANVTALNNLKIELDEAQKTFKEKHPQIVAISDRIKLTLEKIKRAKQNTIKSLRVQFETAISHEQMKYKDMMDYKEIALQVNHDALQYSLLEREISTSRKLYELLAQQLEKSSIQAAVPSVSLRVVEPPFKPLKPISKNYPRQLFIAALVGLALGVSLAFLIEYLDISVKTPDDVKNYLDLPVMGLIPDIKIEFDEERLVELTNMMVKEHEEQIKS
ncbi:GumC family protein [candidate division CSSED10-310 bacterium]|uniref:GumC family protein n=1 Tax=candidate division CSSED10-310 bacterium TaxID=2855610 RepID=A0ABV6Z1B5_UNCC1